MTPTTIFVECEAITKVDAEYLINIKAVEILGSEEIFTVSSLQGIAFTNPQTNEDTVYWKATVTTQNPAYINPIQPFSPLNQLPVPPPVPEPEPPTRTQFDLLKEAFESRSGIFSEETAEEEI